ncbi:glycosyltransferase family 4 protein [Tatumella morbirosei]|uniref:glycosyltransferase family 4 protein n=1 Tax=Tatumella morbirosei TaxID=642227 RepID=UPI000A667032|nr:glycosyltransferase family 4 protein [Tatumella morbirosei]
MKVLLINTYYYPYEIGGAEKSVKLLAETLINFGHDVTVLTLGESHDVVLSNINGVRIVRMPMQNCYWPPNGNQSIIKKLKWHCVDLYNRKSLYFAYNCLKGENFDIIHSNNISGFSVSIWGLSKKLGVPLIHTTRDYYLFHPNCTLFKNGINLSVNSLSVRLLSFFKKKYSKKVNGYIGISNYIKNLHCDSGFFKKSISTVIYNSIDKPLNHSEYNQVNVNIGSYSDGSELYRGIVFGYLGRIEKEKGVNFLLETLQEYSKPFTLLIAGDGDKAYIDSLKKINWPKDKKIVFLGKTSIEDFFPMVDLLIVPSLWNEPMGRVVIEAYSFSVPVISSQVGGLSELIEDKSTGFTFIAHNKDSLLNAIDSYERESSLELRKNALSKSDEFSNKILYTNILSFYKTIIESYKGE